MPSGACSCKVVDGNEIAASWPRNSLIIHIFARAPAASGQGRGARSAANPPFSFIYAPYSQNVKKLEAFSYSFRGLQFATLRLYPSVQVRKKHLSWG